MSGCHFVCAATPKKFSKGFPQYRSLLLSRNITNIRGENVSINNGEREAKTIEREKNKMF
jgi:hypothetical protein